MRGVLAISFGLTLLASGAQAQDATVIESSAFESSKAGAFHMASGFVCPWEISDFKLSLAKDFLDEGQICEFSSNTTGADFIWIRLERSRRSAKSKHSSSFSSLDDLISGKTRQKRQQEDFKYLDEPVYGSIWSRPSVQAYGAIGTNGERGFWTTKSNGWIIDFSLTWPKTIGADFGTKSAKTIFTFSSLQMVKQP
jgi:hypothetical protein